MEDLKLPGFYYTQGVIGPDAIRSLDTNPYQIYGAVPGKRLLVHTAVFSYEPGLTPFSSNGNLVLKYGSGSNASNKPNASTQIAGDIFTQTSQVDYTVSGLFGDGTDTGIQATTNLIGQPLLLSCVNAPPSGASADGKLFYYCILTGMAYM